MDNEKESSLSCPKCGEGSITINRLSKKDFDKYGFCVKDKLGSTEVTYYCCPKCHKEICSDGLKMIVVELDK